MPLSAQDVAEITRLLEESQFEELHLEQDGLKITLRRSGAPPRSAPPAAATAPRVSEAPAPAAPAHTGADAGLIVNAPFVGIFYRAPKPGAAPFVDVGTDVTEDTIVGIIEVMKLMNTVRAEVRGTVAQVLVEDGAVVEYGQALLRITPGGVRG
ncbi:MAG TPA: acetyl-CoA carboxylase biotin carboxyl carrier protein [Steroidobacteraceae bacterium]|nr:acetyl-CoA carboxylase biotin carboxyl carrier protein [Steroidobacteraceae bacterium]